MDSLLKPGEASNQLRHKVSDHTLGPQFFLCSVLTSGKGQHRLRSSDGRPNQHDVDIRLLHPPRRQDVPKYHLVKVMSVTEDLTSPHRGHILPMPKMLLYSR